MLKTVEIIKQLSRDLNLPFTGIEQDWVIEVLDATKVNDFLKYYTSRNFSDEEKVLLMDLIIASYEDYLVSNEIKVDRKWLEIEIILKSEKILFGTLIDYWSLNGETEPENFFEISLPMRKLQSDLNT